jgi:cobyric acid synthase CobQ
MDIKPLAVFGTSSGAGKTLITAAILRILSNRGLKVAPFKVQNMSLNSIGIPGGEIAYAQYIQSMAARVKPNPCMNPILLKPEGDKTQIIVKGRYYATKRAGEYFTNKSDEFIKIALECFEYVSEGSDLVIMEGAGSPAEINLPNDISNLKFAKLINAKNVLVADIERGGVFASIVGTFQLVDMVDNIGVIVNKFLGDARILKSGYDFLNKRYGIKVIGTVPKVSHNISEEDSLGQWKPRSGKLNVGVLWMPFMSNLTDLEPLEFQDDLGFDFIKYPNQLEWADIIIIPGSKLTVKDLLYLKEKGFARKLYDYKGKKWIIGLCGGHQIMGKWIEDRVETGIGKVEGLGLLDTHTIMADSKITVSSNAVINHPQFKGIRISGYEIHFGRSTSDDGRSFSTVIEEDGNKTERADGSYDEKTFGTYIHGLFDNYEFLRRFLSTVAQEKGVTLNVKPFSLNMEIEKFSRVVEQNVDIDYILSSLM